MAGIPGAAADALAPAGSQITLKRLGIKALMAAEILAHHNEPDLWAGLLTHKSPDIRLRTLQYLVDRRDGKAKQAVEVSGGLMHAHTIYRDPRPAALSHEEIQQLDAITRKLLPRASLAAQNGPQNQKESNTATEMAEAIELPTLPDEAP